MTIQQTDIDSATGDGFDYPSASQTLVIMSGVAVVSEQFQGAGTSYNNDRLQNYGTLVGSTFGLIDASGYLSSQNVFINEARPDVRLR